MIHRFWPMFLILVSGGIGDEILSNHAPDWIVAYRISFALFLAQLVVRDEWRRYIARQERTSPTLTITPQPDATSDQPQ